MNVGQLRDELDKYPGHYDVAIACTSLDGLDDDLKFAEMVTLRLGSHVFVVIR